MPMTHRAAWGEIWQRVSSPPARGYAIAVILCIATVAVVRWCIGLLEYHAQATAFLLLAKGLAATPVLFFFVPRRWLQQPRLLLFIWWVFPIGVMGGVIPYWGDIGPTHMFEPPLVFLGGLVAMFAPIIPIGIRLELAERANKSNGG